MFEVIGWTISVTTAPRAPSSATFTFQVVVDLKSTPPVKQRLLVDSVEELNTIIAVLQIPGGRLFFDPSTLTLTKTS